MGTLLQLLQMLVGMFVTVKAVMYQAAGEECHVNKTNSILGLTMYASYFVLFFKLFVDNYYLKLKSPKKQASVRDVMRSVSRKITQVVDDDGNEDEKAKQEQLALRAWFLPEVRCMTTFAWRCLSVSVQDYVVFGFMYRPCGHRVARRAPSMTHVQQAHVDGES